MSEQVMPDNRDFFQNDPFLNGFMWIFLGENLFLSWIAEAVGDQLKSNCVNKESFSKLLLKETL